MWDSGGTGSAIYLSDADEGASAVAELADQVQEAAVEARWGEGVSAAWPACPEHLDSHPLTAALEDDVAVWV